MDVAIYETFARMSQPWINNIPEVSWHGANGSVQINGEPAASRYTEARLAKETEEGMLFNIKKQNVPMKMNFSEDEEWPVVFPAIIPRLMINGCQGIGSTIANHWSLYNLKELSAVIQKYIETNVLDYEELYPDYPTGGIIINKKNLSEIHKTGKGKIILRGKAEIKGNSILITEIPYQVYVEPLIDQIKDLVMKDELEGIVSIQNKSDRKRLLIEIECDINPAVVLNKLYKNTNLQKTYNPNQFALVGKTPKLLTLKEYLDIYIQHNYDCIKRENEYDLAKAKDRLEIVDGLLKALEDIDNIIALIKKSESAAAACKNLIGVYNFTERQAKAIVDMKLGRLAHLEKIELNEEKKALTSTIETCSNIINNVSEQSKIFLTRLLSFVKKYGKDRKTEVIHIEVKPEEKEIAEVIPEDVVVVATQSGLIKKVPVASFKVQKKGGKGIKSNDDVILDIIKTNTVDTIMFFTNKGKMYRTVVDNIPSGTNTTKGVLINNIIKLENDEKVMAISSLHRKSTPQYIIFVTKNGMIKKSYLEEYTKTNRNTGIAALNIKDGDELVDIIFQDEEDMILITKKGMSIRFATKEITAIGRIAAGVKSIKLADGDEVVAGLPIHKASDQVAIFTSGGLGKKVKLDEFSTQGRGGRGTIAYKTSEQTGDVVGAAMVSDEDLILLSGNKSICFSAQDIPILSKTGIGNIMIKDSKVSSITKI